MPPQAGQHVRPGFQVIGHFGEGRLGLPDESFQPTCELVDNVQVLAPRSHLDKPFFSKEREGNTCPCAQCNCLIPCRLKFVPDRSERGGQKRSLLDKGATSCLSLVEFFNKRDLILNFLWRPPLAERAKFGFMASVAVCRPRERPQPL